MKTDAAIEAYKEALKLRVGIKESTRQLYQWSLGAILKSWPELTVAKKVKSSAARKVKADKKAASKGCSVAA